MPLCDRVDLADEAWRDALEAFLGGHREALLVDPGQVREAIGLYRREGKRLAIHGSRVINTLKTAQWRGPAAAGSLAAMAISDDPHATAYLNQRAGNVLRVETEDELLRQERAITADGMLASGGAVVRLAPVEPMLGREARRLRLQALKAQFDRDQAAHYGKQAEKAAIQDLRERQLMPLNDRLRSFPDLVGLTATRAGDPGRARPSPDPGAGAPDDTDLRRLQEEVKRWAAEREALAVARERAARDQGDRILRRQVEEASLATLERASETVAERRGDLQQTRWLRCRTGRRAPGRAPVPGALRARSPPRPGGPWATEAGRRAVGQEKTAIKQRANARDGPDELLGRLVIRPQTRQRRRRRPPDPGGLGGRAS